MVQLADDPTDPERWAVLGDVQFDPLDREPLYREALRLDPGNCAEGNLVTAT
jgi:cytochrome c-type biogenesis protein CcmH/NrfG